MDKDRMGLVSSQKKGQVVVVNNGKKHLTRLVVDGWTTRQEKRRVGWECEISVLFSPTLY
jgi:hypothetical protein